MPGVTYKKSSPTSFFSFSTSSGEQITPSAPAFLAVWARLTTCSAIGNEQFCSFAKIESEMDVSSVTASSLGISFPSGVPSANPFCAAAIISLPPRAWIVVQKIPS